MWSYIARSMLALMLSMFVAGCVFDHGSNPADLAIQKIEQYAKSNGESTPPSVEDYISAGVQGVTEENLDALNDAVKVLTAEEVDTKEKIQAIAGQLGINLVPTVDAGGDQGVTEGTAVTLAAIASDPDGTIQSYLWKEGASTLSTQQSFTKSDFGVGTHTVTVTVTDNDGATASDSVTVTVRASNHAPVATAQSVTTDEDTAKSITLSGTDVDGDTLTYTVTQQPAHGTLSGTAPSLTYTPASNYHGSDSFKFKVNDGAVDSAQATVSIAVNSANDAPTVDAGGNRGVTEGTAVTLAAIASDPDGTITGYLWKEGTITLSTQQSFTKSDFGVGTHTVTVTVTDNDGATASDSVTVTVRAKPTYTVGGVSRNIQGDVVLQNNGGDTLTVSSGSSSFVFGTALETGDHYTVSILSAPAYQTCTLNHASGVVNSVNVTDVALDCVDKEYTIGFTVHGLSGGMWLYLNGSPAMGVSNNNSYTLDGQHIHGFEYNLTIHSKPERQVCRIDHAVGTIDVSNVTNVAVQCTTVAFTVGGNLVTGLSAGSSLVIQNNSGDDLTLTRSGPFVFSQTLGDGEGYSVGVKTQPTGQTCGVTHGSGTIQGADIGNVQISCTTNTYTVGGSLSGLDSGESVVLQNNGADDVTLDADGSFVFPEQNDGTSYRVTVKTKPETKLCSVTHDSGTISGANVTDVEVACVTPTGDLRANIGNLGEDKLIDLNVTISKEDASETNTIQLTGTGPNPERFMLEDTIGVGDEYNVTVVAHPEGKVCTTDATRNGTITTAHLHHTAVITCKDAPEPSTTPFVITIKPQWRHSQYSYGFIKKSGLPYLYDVDCDSDGINEAEGLTTSYNCVYDNDDERNISVSGIFPSIQGDYHDCSGIHHILSVEQWGDQHWLTMEAAFLGCRDVVFHATDKPDLSQVTSMANMFEQAVHFNSPIGDWNVSQVTNMANLLNDAKDFNQPLSHWDTSQVTTMNNMFKVAKKFNQPIGDWNTSQVTNMSGMFNAATDFNQSLNWDTSRVTLMSYMFNYASNFNQPLHFQTDSLTNTTGMFRGAGAFNQPLDWNTSSVKTMKGMFLSAGAFNQPLDWDTSRVTDMSEMFMAAGDFNQSLHFTTDSVTNMANMFNSATVFNQPIGDWNTSKVTNMHAMFSNAADFNQPLDWDVSHVTNMKSMFYGASHFNQPLDWDVGNVLRMGSMFYEAVEFNQPIGDWNTSRVTDMSYMLKSATVFDQNLSLWDVSHVTDHTDFATGSPIAGTAKEPSWP